MIRLSLGRTAMATALLWGTIQVAAAQDSKPSNLPPQTQKINELMAKTWAASGKKQTVQATPHEFLRRVFIDLIGRIPTAEEVIDFERDPNRTKLVNRLLYTEKYVPRERNGQPVMLTVTENGKTKKVPLVFNYKEEYAEHWANIWTVWLLTRTGHQDYRNQMQNWLAQQFGEIGILNREGRVTPYNEFVTKLITATGKTNENPAVNFVIHHLGEPIRENRERDGGFDAVPITSRVTKLFLGLQTQCTQCHDHPMNKQWLQADFWGVNSFFRQTVRSATPTPAPMGNNNKNANAVQITLTDDPSLNAEMLTFYPRRDGRTVATYPVMLKDVAQAINGEKSTKMLGEPMPGKTRRQQLADWVIAHDNFGKAYANRIWGHLFGRGLGRDPSFDDFGGNPEIIHPELLTYLGEEFVKYNYDMKKVAEWVCCSDVYQLSHVNPASYRDPKAETPKLDPLFLRMPLKAMSPEVLFNSLMTATKAERKSKEERRDLRSAWERKLVRNFGDDEGNELSFNGTVVQALLMMNGRELNDEIGVGKRANANHVVAEVVRKHRGDARRIYNELFLMTLSRHPSDAELKKLDDVRNGTKITLGSPGATAPKTGGKPPKGSGAVFVPPSGNDPAFFQDVFWALLNTSEFMLNH